MNFTDAMLTVELVIKSKGVPLIIGESGIGKTALVKELQKKNNYKLITVDANLLKEGEIGGLPTVEDYIININGKTINRKRTVYAIHTKLLEIDEELMRDKDGRILIFIDEINRCEHTVQQELMNLILNREINGYILAENIDIVAAMNPSNKYDEYHDSDYAVVDMDPAQENRFVWISMESDVDEWIKWGVKSNIHKDVLDFIATYPQFLNELEGKETIKATPRSWERVSKSYIEYIKNKDEYPKKIFFNVVKGNVGNLIAQQFVSFLDSEKNMLISPEEILYSSDISKLEEKIKKETHTRLYLMAKNILNYISKRKDEKIELGNFIKLLEYYPMDLRMGIIKEIKDNHSGGLYEELLDNDEFINNFFRMYQKIQG